MVSTWSDTEDWDDTSPASTELINWEEHSKNHWMSEQRAEQARFMKVMRELDSENVELSDFSPTIRQKGKQLDSIFRTFRNEIEREDNVSLATYEKMAYRDPAVWAPLQVITSSVKSRGLTFSGGDEVHREYIKRMFEDVNIMDVIGEVLSAFVFGFSVQEKVWQLIPFEGRMLWSIIDYVSLPPKTLKFEALDSGKITKVIQRQFGRRAIRVDDIKINPEKCTIFQYNPRFGNPYGNSGLQAAWKSWFVKHIIERYWAQNTELAGGAIRIFHAGRMNLALAMTFAQKMKSGSLMVAGDGQEWQTIFPPAGSDSSFKSFINYYVGEISKEMGVPVLLLGQSTEFGSRSLSETHFALFKLGLVTPLQNRIIELFNQDIRQVIDVNWGHQEDYPKMGFLTWSTMDLEQMLNVFEKGAKMGIVDYTDADWIRERLEFRAKEGGDFDPEDLFPIAGEKVIGTEQDSFDDPNEANNPIT